MLEELRDLVLAGAPSSWAIAAIGIASIPLSFVLPVLVVRSRCAKRSVHAAVLLTVLGVAAILLGTMVSFARFASLERMLGQITGGTVLLDLERETFRLASRAEARAPLMLGVLTGTLPCVAAVTLFGAGLARTQNRSRPARIAALLLVIGLLAVSLSIVGEQRALRRGELEASSPDGKLPSGVLSSRAGIDARSVLLAWTERATREYRPSMIAGASTSAAGLALGVLVLLRARPSNQNRRSTTRS